MKKLSLLLIILSIFCFQQIKANEINLKNKITKNLRCLVCQGQSVFDSDSEFAISLKVMVDNKLRAF